MSSGFKTENTHDEYHDGIELIFYCLIRLSASVVIAHIYRMQPLL